MDFHRNNIVSYMGEHVASTRCINDDAAYEGAFFDSRETTPGSIFVAMDGEKSAGVRYVVPAIEKGATCVVVNIGYFDELKETLENYSTCDFIFVNDSLFAFGLLGKCAREQFTGDVIGVIGSVGKTTTKNMLRELGGGQAVAHASLGSYNNQTGVPQTLCSLPRNAHHAIIELGESHFGDLNYITVISQPTSLVITNVAEAHMEFLLDLQGVAKTMNETVVLIPEDGTIVLPIDIAHRDIVLNNAKASIVFVVDEETSSAEDIGTYAHARIATITDVKVHSDLTHECTINFEGTTVSLHVPIVGRHFVIDAALAVVSTLLHGEDPAILPSRMKNVEAQGHRMRMVETAMLTVVDDCYNANPASMKASMKAVAEMATTKKCRSVFIMGPMRELGDNSDEFHREVGAFASTVGIDVLVCVDSATKTAAQGVHPDSHFFSSVSECCENISSIVLQGDIVGVKASRGPDPEIPAMVPIVEILSELK